MPKNLAEWRSNLYQQLIYRLGLGNLGAVGTRIVYAWLGVPVPDCDFLRRGVAAIPKLSRMMEEPEQAGASAFVKQHVLSYAEYSIEVPGRAGPVCGSGLHQNGKSAGSFWFQAHVPPFSERADRTTCSEFRMLTSICDELARAGDIGSEAARASCTGSLKVLVNASCCVSCVGAVAQFRLLFPRIAVSLVGGIAPCNDIPLD